MGLEMELFFCENSIKYFCESTIIDVWHSPKYASDTNYEQVLSELGRILLEKLTMLVLPRNTEKREILHVTKQGGQKYTWD